MRRGLGTLVMFLPLVMRLSRRKVAAKQRCLKTLK